MELRSTSTSLSSLTTSFEAINHHLFRGSGILTPLTTLLLTDQPRTVNPCRAHGFQIPLTPAPEEKSQNKVQTHVHLGGHTVSIEGGSICAEILDLKVKSLPVITL